MSIRICRICEQFPPVQGGLSTGMLQLSLAQHCQGHQIIVITKMAKGDKEFDAGLPFPVMRLHCKRTYQFGWRAYKFYKELSPRPDIVHTHGPSAFYYLLRRRKNDAPIVHTMHILRRFQYALYKQSLSKHQIAKEQGGRYFRFWQLAMLKELLLELMIVKNVDHLCLVASYFREKLYSYYGIELKKTTVVLNGSHFNTGQDKINKSSMASKNQGSVVLFIGRFDWRKRIEILVKAFSFVIGQKPNCQLILVGDGEERDRIKGLVKKLQLENNVFLPGWVESERLEDYYHMADCFCLPSIGEGLPKVLLEALSFGIPVVASDDISHRELLENGKYGEVIGSPDPKAWAEVILRVINGDTIVQTKAEKAKQLVENNYRWEHVAKRVNQAYEKVMSMYS